MRSSIRAVAVAVAIAVPITVSAAPASAAVCIGWTSVRVYDGPPGGDVYVPLPGSADPSCTVTAVLELVQ